MRGLPIGLLAILAALLLPGAVAVHGVAQQHAACPVREAMRLRSRDVNYPPNLALRGGSDNEGRAIKFGELASLVADGWSKIPQEKRRDLANFVVKTIHPSTSDPGAPEAVSVAAGILTFRVLRKFFPYWQDLLSRLERIFSLGGSNRAAKMSVAVREACEVFLSTATGTNVSIGALALPSDKRGPTVVENVRVDNPGGFRAGKAALAIGRMEVQARMHLPPEAFSSRTLTLLDVDTVAITDMAVRVEVASLKNLFSGEAKTNLEAITKHLDHNKKKVDKVVPREGGKMVVRQLRMAGCAVDLASANADEAIHFKLADMTLELGDAAIFPEDLPAAIWAAVVKEIMHKVAELNPMSEHGAGRALRNETVAALQKSVAQSVENMEMQREMLAKAAEGVGNVLQQAGEHLGGALQQATVNVGGALQHVAAGVGGLLGNILNKGQQQGDAPAPVGQPRTMAAPAEQSAGQDAAAGPAEDPGADSGAAKSVHELMSELGLSGGPAEGN